MSNQAPTLYKLPGRRRDGIAWEAIFVGLVGLFLTNQITTQYLAHKFGYQQALGAPLFWKVYEAWDWAIWYWQFADYQSDVVQSSFHTSLYLVVILSFLSVMAAVLVSFLKTRKKDDAIDLHGSARWGDIEDARKAGLLPKPGEKGKGVYVGAIESGGRQHYLRHDGKEHTLVFAPTRSGKGVGLVLPTLLSWPHSVLVHDIKGENYALTAGYRRSIGQYCLKFSPVEMNNPMDRVDIKMKDEADTPKVRDREYQSALSLALEMLGQKPAQDEVDLLSCAVLHVAYVGYDPRMDGMEFAYGQATEEGKAIEADRSPAGLWAFLNRPAEKVFDDLLNLAFDITGRTPPGSKAKFEPLYGQLDHIESTMRLLLERVSAADSEILVQRVHAKFNDYRLREKTTTARFNPLVEIRVGTPHETKDVQNIATMIVDPDGKGLNDHWAKTGFSLLVGTILHVLYAENDKTLRGVAAYLSDPQFSNVDQMFSNMMNTEHDPSGRMGWRDATGNPTKVHPVVAQSAKDMLNKADNEKSGVLSTAMSFLSLYRDPLVAASTEASDFRIRDLMNADKPVSLYLVVPPSDKDRLKPLVRLVLNQVVRALTEDMTFANGQSVEGYAHRLLLMIDEFPALGKLDVFQEALAFIAGYGLKAYLIAQDLSQLYASYTRDESIISNCHVRVAYAPNKIETAELLSKMTGITTVAYEQRSFSGSRFQPMMGHVSSNEQLTQRPLLTADECMSLPPSDMLVFVAGARAIYGKKIIYYSDPVFDARSKIQTPAVSDRVRKPGERKPWDGGADGMMQIKRRADAVKIAFAGEPAPSAPAAAPSQASPVVTESATQGDGTIGTFVQFSEPPVGTAGRILHDAGIAAPGFLHIPPGMSKEQAIAALSGNPHTDKVEDSEAVSVDSNTETSASPDAQCESIFDLLSSADPAEDEPASDDAPVTEDGVEEDKGASSSDALAKLQAMVDKKYTPSAMQMDDLADHEQIKGLL